MRGVIDRGKGRFFRGATAALLALLLAGAIAIPDKAAFADEGAAPADGAAGGADGSSAARCLEGEGTDAGPDGSRTAQCLEGEGTDAGPGQPAGDAALGVPPTEAGPDTPQAGAVAAAGEEALAGACEAPGQDSIEPFFADDPVAPPPAGGHGWLAYWQSFAPALVGSTPVKYTGVSASAIGNNMVDYIYWNPYTNMLYFMVYHVPGSPAYVITSVTTGPPGGARASLIAAATAGRTYQLFGASLPGGLPDPLEFTGGTTGGPDAQNIVGNISFAGRIVTYAPGDYGDWAACSIPGCEEGSATPAPPSCHANSKGQGYVFDGWTPALRPVVAGNIVYEAMWAPLPAGKHLVVYDGNGGLTPDGAAYCTDTAAYAEGDPIQIAGNGFVRPGYGFIGWNTAPDGSGDGYGPGAGIMPGMNLVLYAQWPKAPYRVAYDGNGQTGGLSPADPNIYYIGGQATVLPGTPSRTGHKFAGWLYGGRIYVAGDRLVMPAGDVTFVAQWTRLTYSIQYEPNGGTGAMEDTKATYNKAVTLGRNSFAREGYTFKGWNTRADGSGTSYRDGYRFARWARAGGLTLYAQWKESAEAAPAGPPAAGQEPEAQGPGGINLNDPAGGPAGAGPDEAGGAAGEGPDETAPGAEAEASIPEEGAPEAAAPAPQAAGPGHEKAEAGQEAVTGAGARALIGLTPIYAAWVLLAMVLLAYAIRRHNKAREEEGLK